VGARTHFDPGTFCWVDLVTDDPEGSEDFYRTLLGWESEVMAGGYRMQRIGGADVAGITAQGEQERVAGAGPAWLSSVAVADADEATARAVELGGAVVAPPADVLELGRAAVVRDPQGAALGLWQARAHPGAGLVNDPGSLVINQLDTTHVDGATVFYGELFGWEITQVASEPVAYWRIANRGRLNGGMMGIDPSDAASAGWLAFFTSAHIDADADAVAAAGGTVASGPTAVPGGRILVARDPRGASFALFEGGVDP
jgi:predicted enzyme related to lactoylglutathione lyase